MSVVAESFVAADPSATAALAELGDQIGRRGVAPRFIFVFYVQVHDDAVINDFARSRFSGVPLVGGTSCSGTMSERGHGGSQSIGMLLVQDLARFYGAVGMRLGDDLAAAAEAALKNALEAADSTGELPQMVRIYQSTVHKEAVVQGLRRVVGHRCLIVGGSAADEEVDRRWRQLNPDGPLTDGLAVSGVLVRAADSEARFPRRRHGMSGPTVALVGESGVVRSLCNTFQCGHTGAHGMDAAGMHLRGRDSVGWVGLVPLGRGCRRRTGLPADVSCPVSLRRDTMVRR